MKKIILSLVLLSSVIFGKVLEIPTGSTTGTYFQVGKDIATVNNKNVEDFEMKAVVGKGSVKNVGLIFKHPLVKLTPVQSDVLEELEKMAKNGNTKAKKYLKKLRVLFPLYNEEIHPITRANMDITHLHEIEDLRINIGSIGSGTAMTVNNVYNKMFQHGIPKENLFTMGYKDALRALLNDEIDVVFFVGGQPLNILNKDENSAQLKNYIKLLTVDEKSEYTDRLKDSSYIFTSIDSDNYLWLDEDKSTLAVKAMMVTFDYKTNPTKRKLQELVKALKDNKDWLNENGHPKWNKVSLEYEKLPNGWKYYEPITHILKGEKEMVKKVKKSKTKNTHEGSLTAEQLLGL